MRQAIALMGVWLASVSASAPPRPVALDLILGEALPPRLSDFRFFSHMKAKRPNRGVMSYRLNTQLFSDYTDKNRYVWVPPGKRAQYRVDGAFAFPMGTALIKSFGYPDAGVIETRVLINRASGWVALPYVWLPDGSDAELKRAGKRVSVSFTDPKGAKRSISYAVPNVNQCKGCHDVKGALSPIGPKARNLNDGHQLSNWQKAGILDAVPADAPAAPRFDDPTARLDLRARAYLDVNCGHCHNRDGPANTSGLWLDWGQPADVNLGLNKRPTAAGRGSANLDFAIAPGKPDQSYLISRMESLDPGVAMPELGRATVHEEGVDLLRRWIAEMKQGS